MSCVPAQQHMHEESLTISQALRYFMPAVVLTDVLDTSEEPAASIINYPEDGHCRIL